MASQPPLVRHTATQPEGPNVDPAGWPFIRIANATWASIRAWGPLTVPFDNYIGNGLSVESKG